MQGNQLGSIAEVENLLCLEEFYICNNRISCLAGLTEAHADSMKKLVCMPNENLKPKVVIAAERELGILCR